MLTRRPARVSGFVCLLAVACLAWGLAAPAASRAAQDALPASPPAPAGGAAAEIGTLVRELGDADFRVREEATRRLRQIGRAAVPALREALGGDDPEVSSRADSLLRQIEKPRIPQGWFRNFNGWRRSETRRNGARVISVVERDRQVEVVEGPAGIQMTVSGVDEGESVNVVLRARDADDLRRQDADAYAIYERVAGARSNVNIRGRRLLVPPVPLPDAGAVPLPRPVPGRRPAARLLPLAPEGGLARPPADDLPGLEERLRRQMEGAGVAEAERQAVMEALRMLREIQAQGMLLPPDDLEAQIRKYNALSDAVRQKLEELKLPGPGDALPPPARARLGVSVAPEPAEPNGAGGALVRMVLPGSRGEKLGLREGDVIRRVNDQRVDDAAGLRRVLTETKEPLAVVVKRPGEAEVLLLREKAE